MENHKTDPLAEAEMYIAYGRVEQAVQVLREAIKREPNRKDLWDKLAEIIRRGPSVGISPTVSFKGSSGHSMDADGTEVFKVGIVGKIILFIFSIIFFGGGLGGIFGGDFNWKLILIIDILYILFIINLLSYSVKLTEDRMIVSSLVRSRSFSYAEIGMVSYSGGGRGGYSVDVYDKEGKRVFSETWLDITGQALVGSLKRRAEKYGYRTAYEMLVNNISKNTGELSKNAARRIVTYIIIAVVIIICAVIARLIGII